MKFYLVLVIVFLSACSGDHSKYKQAEYNTAKEILRNRSMYAKEIRDFTNDCIKSSTSITHLTAAGNDQEESIDACFEAAQKTYGAYSSKFMDDGLLIIVMRASENKEQ